MKSLNFPKISRKSFYEAFFTIGGRILSVFIVIASTKFLTTFLSEADYGQLALYNITALLPSTFYFSPITQGVMRFFPIAKEQNQIALFRNQLQSLYYRGAGVALSVGLTLSLICWYFGEIHWAFACIIIAALNIVNAFNTTWYGMQNVARKRKLALGLEVSDRLLQQGVAILLLLFVFHDPLMVITGYLIAAVLFFFINRHFYLKTFPIEKNDTPEFSKANYTKNVLQYSWPFILIGIFFWFQNASERWTLEIFQSTETVGQFAVLNQVGFQSLGIFFASINYFLYPILFNRAGSLKSHKQFDSANQVNNFYLLFILVTSLSVLAVFSAFSESIICLLTDKKYISVAPLLPVMVIAGGFFYFGQYFANRFTLSLQSKLLILPKIITALLGFGMNLAGSYYYGLPGLVFSLVFAHIIFVAAIMFRWKTNGQTYLTETQRTQA